MKNSKFTKKIKEVNPEKIKNFNQVLKIMIQSNIKKKTNFQLYKLKLKPEKKFQIPKKDSKKIYSRFITKIYLSQKKKIKISNVYQPK